MNNQRAQTGPFFDGYFSTCGNKNATGVTAPVAFRASGALGRHSEIIERNIADNTSVASYLQIVPTIVKEHNIACLNIDCWSKNTAVFYAASVIPSQLHREYKYKVHNKGILVVHKSDLKHFVQDTLFSISH